MENDIFNLLFSGWIMMTLFLFVVINYLLESYTLAKMSQVQFGQTHKWAFIPFLRMMTLIKLSNSKAKSYEAYNRPLVIGLLLLILWVPYIKVVFYYNILSMRDMNSVFILLVVYILCPIIFLVILFMHRHDTVSESYEQPSIYAYLLN